MHLRREHIIFLLFIACILLPFISSAQHRKKSIKEVTKKKEESPNLHSAPKRDTTIIIERVETKEKHAQEKIEPLFPAKETVIIIKDPKKAKAASGKKKDTVIVFVKDEPSPKKMDTVIVLKKGKQVKQVVDHDALEKGKIKKVPVIIDSGNCTCVEMTIGAPDTIRFGDYLSYHYIFRNKCKDVVYISSASFRFVPFNYFNQRVRVLRKSEFVKRFNLPDFVKLLPGETYSFDFADDPFFEFDLKRQEIYKFNFIYSNPLLKYRSAPSKTYQCTEFKDKMIFIK